MATPTWEDIWASLLAEARFLADRSEDTTTGRLGPAAASVIVTRAAWEAYVSEFIEWRDLDGGLKLLPFEERLEGLHVELGITAQYSRRGGKWASLRLVNGLRNALVHFAATPRSDGESPGQWFSELINLGVVQGSANTTWEKRACTPRVAHWACDVVGMAILTLEGEPMKRRRSVAAVKRIVHTALGRDPQSRSPGQGLP